MSEEPKRIWPDAADGSPALPMEPELWAVVGNRGFEPSDRPVPWLFNHMSDAQGKADHLNRFDNTNQYYAAPVFVVRKEWVKAVQDRAALQPKGGE